ncbi:hypothetical protein [Lacticaseibacillus salsurivasis]|uniref:hypothetical protein n=1 Tax=Lacticaseibacillus salsurivasis TaxID=3081441 RepID=UPI0030C69C46
MKKFWVVFGLFTILILSACNKDKMQIESGVTANDVFVKYNGATYNAKVSVKLPVEAKYLTVYYDGYVQKSLKANSDHIVTYTDYIYGKPTVKLLATIKQYEYGDAFSLVESVDTLALKGAGLKEPAEDETESVDDETDFDTSTDDSFEDESEYDSEDDTSSSESFNAADYSTGITFENLARTPDEYKYRKFQMTGKVLQVMEGDEVNNLRVGINGKYSDVVLVEYDPGIMAGSRVLEGDKITFYGTSFGTTSYESTMGATITVPDVLVVKIEDFGNAPANYGY